MAAILLVACLIRWQLREFPLERDEGEYAYMGQLLLEGVPPYQVAANHKFPGAYLAYAGILAVFGQTAAAVHLGMLVVNLANTVLLFALSRRLIGTMAALMAAAAWVLMSVGPGVFGAAGHLTHFVVFFVLAGLSLLARAVDSGKAGYLAAAGVCFGCSIVMRQTSVVFAAFGGLFWLGRTLYRPRENRIPHILRRALAFTSGVLAPLLLVSLWLWRAGVFGPFWQWTVVQAAVYGTEMTWADGFRHFISQNRYVIGPCALIWIGAAAGLVLIVRERSWRTAFIVGFLVVGFVATSFGLHFREHYYLQLLPAIALLFGHAVAVAWNTVRPKTVAFRLVAFGAVAGALAQPLLAQPWYFFKTSPNELSRRVYEFNPFPEAVEIAHYIRDRTGPNATVAVLGSEPEIFFYAHRRSATGFIYTYPLLEHHPRAHEMQETMAREIEAAAPEFIVFVNVQMSWLSKPGDDLFIIHWADKFLDQHYRLEGIVDILPHETHYVWGREAAAYRCSSLAFITVHRRNPSPKPVVTALRSTERE